jgi:excisionase family DNA binding protein
MWFRLSRKRVYELAGKGKLPSIRVAGSVRFRRSDLEALLDGSADTHGKETRRATAR